MFDSSRSSIIIRPRNVSDIDRVLLEHPNAAFFGGGTHIMRLPDAQYPKMKYYEIVDLMDRGQFNVVRKTYDDVEIGGCVTLSSLCETNSGYIPEVVQKCLRNIPYSIGRVATVGGTLRPAGIIYDLAVSAAVCGCVVEVRRKVDDKVVAEKVSVEELYKMGRMKSADNYFIEKVHFPRRDARYHSIYKRGGGSVFADPNKSVVIACSFLAEDDQLSRLSVAVCYANKAVCVMGQTIHEMTDIVLRYFNYSSLQKIKQTFSLELAEKFPQDMRNGETEFLFESILEEMQLRLL